MRIIEVQPLPSDADAADLAAVLACATPGQAYSLDLGDGRLALLVLSALRPAGVSAEGVAPIRVRDAYIDLFPAIGALVLAGSSIHAACLKLAYQGEIPGNGTPENKANALGTASGFMPRTRQASAKRSRKTLKSVTRGPAHALPVIIPLYSPASDPIAAALKVGEDRFCLSSLERSLRSDFGLVRQCQAHADCEEDIVTLSLEWHAAMFAFCSRRIKPGSLRLVERVRGGRRVK